MDLFNTIAKAVVDTATNVAKAVVDVKPSQVKGAIQPIHYELEEKQKIELEQKHKNEMKPRILNVGKKEESDEQSTGLF